jgi:hypothetical protein
MAMSVTEPSFGAAWRMVRPQRQNVHVGGSCHLKHNARGSDSYCQMDLEGEGDLIPRRLVNRISAAVGEVDTMVLGWPVFLEWSSSPAWSLLCYSVRIDFLAARARMDPESIPDKDS